MPYEYNRKLSLEGVGSEWDGYDPRIKAVEKAVRDLEDAVRLEMLKNQERAEKRLVSR